MFWKIHYFYLSYVIIFILLVCNPKLTENLIFLISIGSPLNYINLIFPIFSFKFQMGWNATCEEDFPSSDVVRLILIVGMGTTVCVVGIFLNTFLLLSFFRSPSLHSDILYLFLLAAFDILVEICFMLIFPASLLWDYFRMVILYNYWHHYIRYVSTAGQVLIAASTLLIVVASFERYICSLRSSGGFSPLQRYAALGVVLIASIIMKGSVFFELELSHLPHCPPFANLRLDLSEITHSEQYKTIWMFWCRNVLNVFLPFFLLLLLNSATTFNHSKSHKDFEAVLVQHLPSILQTVGDASVTRRRKRDATRTLAALVSIYLLTNTLNLLITIMEFIEPDILRSMGDGWTYKYLADLSSLLTISSTATRLPVYLHCNGAIREQIKHFFHSCANQRKEKMIVVNL